MSEKIVQLNEEVIKGQLKELVRGSVDYRQKKFFSALASLLKERDEAEGTCRLLKPAQK